MRKLALSLLALASLTIASASDTPPSANDLITAARASGAVQHKNVMIIFHASWCGWCHKFEKFMNLPQFKPLFEKNYEIVRLDTMENEDKKNLENEGSDKVMASFGGTGQGIPFFAVTSPKGKVLFTSMRPDPKKKEGVNIGHPAAPEEVAYFVTVLQKTSKMSPTEIATIEAWLKAQK